jgi:hypothetical protein
LPLGGPKQITTHDRDGDTDIDIDIGIERLEDLADHATLKTTTNKSDRIAAHATEVATHSLRSSPDSQKVSGATSPRMRTRDRTSRLPLAIVTILVSAMVISVVVTVLLTESTTVVAPAALVPETGPARTTQPARAAETPLAATIDAPALEHQVVDPKKETRGSTRPKRHHHGPTKGAAPSQLSSGRLLLNTKPAVEVQVDGRVVGRTPLAGPLPLTPGKHTVRLVNRALGVMHKEEVHIEVGKTNRLHRVFRTGTVQVYAMPFGEVFIDGVSKGLTPLDGPIEVYEGEHAIRVTCSLNGKEKRRKVKVEPGRQLVVKFDLR